MSNEEDIAQLEDQPRALTATMNSNSFVLFPFFGWYKTEHPLAYGGSKLPKTQLS